MIIFSEIKAASTVKSTTQKTHHFVGGTYAASD